MAKNHGNVAMLLSSLAVKMQPIFTKEKEIMLKLKEEESNKLGFNFNGKIDFWDMPYYSNMVQELNYSVDQQVLKEYFPIGKVTEGLMEIYQELLGLKFTECDYPEKWCRDVKLVRAKNLQIGESS